MRSIRETASLASLPQYPLTRGLYSGRRHPILEGLKAQTAQMALALYRTGKHVYEPESTTPAERAKRRKQNRVARKSRTINRRK